MKGVSGREREREMILSTELLIHSSCMAVVVVVVVVIASADDDERNDEREVRVKTAADHFKTDNEEEEDRRPLFAKVSQAVAVQSEHSMHRGTSQTVHRGTSQRQDTK